MKFVFAAALPISTLSLGLACKPPGDAPTTPTTDVPPDPLATWVADHFGPGRFFVPYSSADPQRGSQDNALVTIVVFIDFSFLQPEFTQRLDKLLADHGDELLVIIKPIMNHDNPTAKLAALTVLAAAEQGRGWEMHELLGEARHVNSLEEAHSHAAQIGIPNLSRFDATLERAATATLQTNTELALQLGVNTDPFWFVNGAPYTGVMSFEDLSAIHAVERELAVGLVRAGARPQDVYATIVQDAPLRREPAITYRRPFDGPPPRSSKTLANDVVIEDFVLGEGEGVREGTMITFNFRGYSTIDPRQVMGSRGEPSELIINGKALANDPIARATMEALQDMKVGGKRRVRIPAEIVQRGAPERPPMGDLILTVELVSVSPAPILAGIEAFAGKPLRSKKSPNGLDVQDYAAGEGEAAKQGDRVAVHYIGHLADGTEFDHSHARANALVLTVGGKETIPGFGLGLEGARAGMLRKIVIPPELGYGDKELPKIPAGSTLTFYVQIMSVSAPTEPKAEPEAE